MTRRVALATAAEFPDLDEDGAVLVSALGDRGVAAEPLVWTDDSADPASYDLVVVRCTWDYHVHHDAFLAWADRVASVTQLANPAGVVRWNTDKTYLRELADLGVPVVETAWFDPGDDVVLPEAGEYVVKPAVSAGSKDTNRYVAGVHDEVARDHVADLLGRGKTVMLQPYLHQVDTFGETALLHFAGQYSHAIRKGPLLEVGMPLVEGAYKEETVEPREPGGAEHAVATAVLAAMPHTSARTAGDDLLYARVDVVPDASGAPVLLELELTEPSMFLVHDGDGGALAAGRFADAIVASLDRAGR